MTQIKMQRIKLQTFRFKDIREKVFHSIKRDREEEKQKGE